MSPEFGELLLELLVLYGQHEDSDKQAAFLNRTIASGPERLAAMREVMTCMKAVSAADRNLSAVINDINAATRQFEDECVAAGLAVPQSVSTSIKAGARAAAVDSAIGESSNLDARYKVAYAAVLAARRAVSSSLTMIGARS
jgi:hypothetical protein